MILLDSSGLWSAIDASQPRHRESRLALQAEQPPYVLSPFVLAELDYLIVRDAGVGAELQFLLGVARGVYELAAFEPEDVGAARRLVARYRDLRIGLTDASIAVLAERYGTNRVLTLDERHFRALKLAGGKPFVVLPEDAEHETL